MYSYVVIIEDMIRYDIFIPIKGPMKSKVMYYNDFYNCYNNVDINHKCEFNYFNS